MPLISELTRDVAARLRLEESLVGNVARALREAGLISQAARGVHAARATPLDAARLLIALMVGGKLREASTAVADFGLLKFGAILPARRSARDLFASGYGLSDPSFEEALAALIAGFGDQKVYAALTQEQALNSLGDTSVVIRDTHFDAQIRLDGQTYLFQHAAFIEEQRHHAQVVAEQRAGAPASTPFEALAAISAISSGAWAERSRYWSGIHSQRMVTANVLMPLGEMLFGLRSPGEMDSEEELNAQRAESLR